MKKKVFLFSICLVFTFVIGLIAMNSNERLTVSTSTRVTKQ